jgi:hypothetical protein
MAMSVEMIFNQFNSTDCLVRRLANVIGNIPYVETDASQGVLPARAPGRI